MNREAQVLDVVARFSDEAREAELLLFITRASELQVARIRSLSLFLEELGDIKKQYQAAAIENKSNLVLSMELLIKALRSELAMWLLLKDDKPEQAWDHFIDAQDYASAAVRSHEFGQRALRRFPIYDSIESVVFPPQAFSSVGCTVEYRECSVCGSSYDDCEHIAGLPSMGEYCSIVIKNVEALEEVSIVENPADKRCRVVEFGDRGHFRNKMTWRLDTSTEADDGTIRGYAVRYV